MLTHEKDKEFMKHKLEAIKAFSVLPLKDMVDKMKEVKREVDEKYKQVRDLCNELDILVTLQYDSSVGYTFKRKNGFYLGAGLLRSEVTKRTFWLKIKEDIPKYWAFTDGRMTFIGSTMKVPTKLAAYTAAYDLELLKVFKNGAAIYAANDGAMLLAYTIQTIEKNFLEGE